MPFRNIAELPKNVKVLPKNAQKMWLATFNSAFSRSGEKAAIKIAWAAIKRSYKKNKQGDWVKKTAITKPNFKIYGEITKFDEEQRMVYGIATNDSLDSQGDIIDAEATRKALPEYSKWRNVREMHGDSVAGTAPILELKGKGLEIGAHIVDDMAWKKVKSGAYKGFSIGGKAKTSVEEFNEELGKNVNRITEYDLMEISLVDRPANPEAIISMFKREVTAMEEKRKKLGMSVSQFYAVPRDPPSASKLPIFDAAHVRNALARFSQVSGLTAEEKAKAKRKILAAAKKFGIDVGGSKDSKKKYEVDSMDDIKKEEEAKAVEETVEEVEAPVEEVEETKTEEVEETEPVEEEATEDTEEAEAEDTEEEASDKAEEDVSEDEAEDEEEASDEEAEKSGVKSEEITITKAEYDTLKAEAKLAKKQEAVLDKMSKMVKAISLPDKKLVEKRSKEETIKDELKKKSIGELATGPGGFLK